MLTKEGRQTDDRVINSDIGMRGNQNAILIKWHDFIAPEKVQRAMKRTTRMHYGDPQSEEYTLPADLRKTEMGQIFHKAYSRLYTAHNLLTAKQAYSLLGIARQTLYERRDRGKLTSIYWHGELRFLRSEIEAWKAQRDQRQQEGDPEER